MKYFISLILLFSFEVFSQHMLILNTGEKLHGKLIEVRNGKIKFQFQNNLMMFKEKDVVLIVLDTLSLSLLSIDKQKPTEGSIIKGVVTSHLRKNTGNKPDVGAKIYVINVNDLDNTDTLTISNFIFARSVELKLLNLEGMSLEEYENYKYRELSKVDAETRGKLNLLHENAVMAVNKIRDNVKTIKLIADGNGSFLKTLKPGIYYILIESNEKSDLILMEHIRNIKTFRIRLGSGDEEMISADFDEY